MTLRELQKSISNTPSKKNDLIKSYLETEFNPIRKTFVETIKDIHWWNAQKMIDLYLDAVEGISVNDLVNSRDYVLFEYQQETFQFAGMVDGAPKFKRFGSPDLIDFPYPMDELVSRLF